MFGQGGFGAKPPGAQGLSFGATGFGAGQATGFGTTPGAATTGGLGGGTGFGAPAQTNAWGASTGTTGMGTLGQPATGFGTTPTTGKHGYSLILVVVNLKMIVFLP